MRSGRHTVGRRSWRNLENVNRSAVQASNRVERKRGRGFVSKIDGGWCNEEVRYGCRAGYNLAFDADAGGERPSLLPQEVLLSPPISRVRVRPPVLSAAVLLSPVSVVSASLLLSAAPLLPPDVLLLLSAAVLLWARGGRFHLAVAPRTHGSQANLRKADGRRTRICLRPIPNSKIVARHLAERSRVDLRCGFFLLCHTAIPPPAGHAIDFSPTTHSLHGTLTAICEQPKREVDHLASLISQNSYHRPKN